MNDGIIIQARTGSTRLPNKILLPFYGDKSILDIIIEGIRNECADKLIVLATTNAVQDDILEQYALKNNIVCYRGSEDDVLDRFINAAKENNLDRFVRVCSDNPFLRVDTFNNLFEAHDETKCDYVAYGFADGRPTIKSHLGLFSELTTLDALQRVAQLTSEKLYIEHVTIYLYTHLTQFSIKLLNLPLELEERTDLRLTLDTMDDFKLLQEIYAKYVETDKSIEALLRLIDANPGYKILMRQNIECNEK